MFRTAYFLALAFYVSFFTDGKTIGCELDEHSHMTQVHLSLEQQIRTVSWQEISRFRFAEHNVKEIRDILRRHTHYVPSLHAISFESYKESFETYFKALCLLQRLEKLDPSDFADWYTQVQNFQQSAEGECEGSIERPQSYVYWTDCLAYLNREVRSEVIGCYERGDFPFPKDLNRAQFFKCFPDLPLSNSVIIQWRLENATSCPLRLKKN